MSQIATKQSFDTNLAQLNLVAPLGSSTQSTQPGSTSLLNFTWSSKSTSCHRRMRITQQRSNGSGLLRIAQIKLVANRIRLAQPTHTTGGRGGYRKGGDLLRFCVASEVLCCVRTKTRYVIDGHDVCIRWPTRHITRRLRS